jgi:hypothetical protein
MSGYQPAVTVSSDLTTRVSRSNQLLTYQKAGLIGGQRWMPRATLRRASVVRRALEIIVVYRGVDIYACSRTACH